MLNTNEVRIETCTKCMYSCIFCPHSTNFKRKKEVMDFRMFCYIVDKIKKELPEITDLTISGFGEAFLDDNILDKIYYSKLSGYKVHVVSNGFYLNERTVKDLKYFRVEDIRISLHSIEYGAYRKLTRASRFHFERVIKNIQNIINLNIPLILTFEIIPGINDDQIDFIKDQYGHYAIIEMWKPHNWVSTFDYRKGPIVKSTCGRPWNSPYQIQVDGTVNMCCFDYNGELLLGNFLVESMQDIFNGDVYLDLRHHHENGTLNTSKYICKDCDQRKSQDGIVIYNNKFNIKDRLYRTSTNYARITE